MSRHPVSPDHYHSHPDIFTYCVAAPVNLSSIRATMFHVHHITSQATERRTILTRNQMFFFQTMVCTLSTTSSVYSTGDHE